MSIAKVIDKNKGNFEKWGQQLADHFEVISSYSNSDKEKIERVFYQTNQLLLDIGKNFFLYGKFKDTWDTSKCHLNFMGQNLLFRSEKMDITFDWGLDYNEFYLECSIMYPENLRYMKDDFWSDLLELKSLGEFEFTGMAYTNVKERPYFDNKTSTVFQMIRNYILYHVDKMETENYNLPPSMDMGQLIIKWHVDTEFEKLLEQSCKAFKALYTINYKLWKISDLARKSGK